MKIAIAWKLAVGFVGAAVSVGALSGASAQATDGWQRPALPRSLLLTSPLQKDPRTGWGGGVGPVSIGPKQDDPHTPPPPPPERGRVSAAARAALGARVGLTSIGPKQDDPHTPPPPPPERALSRPGVRPIIVPGVRPATLPGANRR